MKHFIILIGFLFIGVLIYAQDSSVNFKKLKELKLPDFKINKVPFKYSDQLGKNYFSSSKTYFEQEISILPLDNMPCFVPDISLISKMPNQLGNGFAVRIPNKITVEIK